MSKKYKQEFLEAIEIALKTDVFPRNSLPKLTGGLINDRTIANKMSKGKGPPGFRYGRRVCFIKHTFLEWLKNEYIEEIK